jgi:hypothetical protein
MRGKASTLIVLVTIACGMAACAAPARPRQRPVPAADVESGTGTMSEVRRQLQGRWTLVSLNVTTEDGRKSAIDATGALNSDAFGGLEIEYRMSESGQQSLASLGIKSPNPVVSTAGRVVIDAQRQQITYAADDFNTRALGFDPDLAARRANPFALERVRHYQFAEDGTLTLTTRYDNGKDAAVARWKKAS